MGSLPSLPAVVTRRQKTKGPRASFSTSPCPVEAIPRPEVQPGWEPLNPSESADPAASRVANELAQRQIAYEKRRSAKREAKKYRNNSGDLGKSDLFLSNLPEVEADVQYRFSFIVSGQGGYAKRVAEAACTSHAARSMPDVVNEADEEPASAHDEPTSAYPSVAHTASRDLPPLEGLEDNREGIIELRRGASSNSKLRCLCKMTDAAEVVRGKTEKPRLAKLAFMPRSSPAQQVPSCQNRLEALNTALIYVLVVDQELPLFEAQLRQLTDSVEGLRARSRPRNRPVRAVLLCYEKEQDVNGKDYWVECMADYEQAHGDVWKFGPIGMWDADGLHAIFAEIAAARIPFGAGDEATNPAKENSRRLEGGKFSAGASCKEEDLDAEEDDGYDEPAEPTAQRLQLPPVSVNNRNFGSERSSSSGVSEGWQQPPVFTAESEGSECSERAIELHRRLYALQGEAGTSPPALHPQALPIE